MIVSFVRNLVRVARKTVSGVSRVAHVVDKTVAVIRKVVRNGRKAVFFVRKPVNVADKAENLINHVETFVRNLVGGVDKTSNPAETAGIGRLGLKKGQIGLAGMVLRPISAASAVGAASWWNPRPDKLKLRQERHDFVASVCDRRNGAHRPTLQWKMPPRRGWGF